MVDSNDRARAKIGTIKSISSDVIPRILSQVFGAEIGGKSIMRKLMITTAAGALVALGALALANGDEAKSAPSETATDQAESADTADGAEESTTRPVATTESVQADAEAKVAPPDANKSFGNPTKRDADVDREQAEREAADKAAREKAEREERARRDEDRGPGRLEAGGPEPGPDPEPGPSVGDHDGYGSNPVEPD